MDKVPVSWSEHNSNLVEHLSQDSSASLATIFEFTFLLKRHFIFHLSGHKPFPVADDCLNR